jgi:hypothetical protein
MNSLYNNINTFLSNGSTLLEIKNDLFTDFDSGVLEYCNEKATFTNGKYNRIKLYDYSNDLFETILICWDANSESKIHDHPENGCILQLFEGQLEENLYDSDLKLIKHTTINSNNVSYMDNNIGFHKIKCIDKAMSLHIYSPPNHKMKILGT